MKPKLQKRTDALLLILIQLLSCHFYIVTATGKQKVLIISLDGFRYDYQNKTNTPNLDWIVKNGISTEFVHNIFPTVTLPNHVTMLTGLYPENHGMISNEMYDPETKEVYNLVKKNNSEKWWVNATPIWIDNELQGHDSGVMYWPGYDVHFNNTSAKYIPDTTKVYPFHKSATSEEIANRVDTACDWLKKDNVTFVALYIEQPDDIAHKTGPDRDNKKLEEKIREVDALIGKIRKRLSDDKIDDQVNVLIMGDHGSVNLSYKRVVNLYNFVNISKYSHYFSGRTFVMIQPRGGFKQYIYSKLLKESKSHKFKVYLKKDIPDEFHIKNNKRVGEILVLCEPGWTCIPNGYKQNWFDRTNDYWEIGDHGFTNFNRNMNPAFYAFGPQFRTGYRKNCVYMVDIYSLMCHILNLKPRKNDGEFNRIRNVLKSEKQTN